MTDYKPTYLMVKRHSITGLKYFCKTIKSDPITYNGSGTRWTRHLRKHGKEHVITEWFKLFTDKDELVEFATKFSTDNNIVVSEEWANLAIENGLDGGPRKTNWLIDVYNSQPRTEEHRANISKGKKGKASNRPNFKQSEETKRKISEAMKGKKRGKRGPYKKRKQAQTFFACMKAK